MLRRRPKGSYKLTQRVGDIAWDMQLIIEKLEAQGVPTSEIISRYRDNKSEMARLLKQEFPERYGAMVTPTRLRQLLHKDFLRKKDLGQIDAFYARVLARILGEE